MTERGALLALFWVSFGLLVDEILLSAIFHVMLGGGSTVMAISVALLGLASSGIVAYLTPALARPAVMEVALTRLVLGFGISLAASTFVIMGLPLNHADLALSNSGLSPQLLRLAACFVAVVPFFIGGLAVAVILRHLAHAVSRLYFADLAGAALGCVASPFLLGLVGAPKGIVLAGLPAVLVAMTSASRQPRSSLLALLLAIVFTATAFLQPDSLRFRRLNTMGPVNAPVHRSVDVGPNDLEFEKWALDAWTIIRSESIPQQWEGFRGWGLSPRYEGPTPRIRLINYNAKFSTYVTEFDGDTDEIGPWLDSDLVSLHYQLGRSFESVLNVGAGGGREVLNAIHHGAQDVTAVDISSVVVEDIMKGTLRSFSGELYLDPRVTAVADEGRSFIERTERRFDLIDFSIVGGMNLEKMDLVRIDDLFTVEALGSYIDHLSPEGTFSYVMYSLRSDLVDQLAQRSSLTALPYVPAQRTLVGLRRVFETRFPERRFSDHVLVAGIPGVIDPSYDLVHIILSRSPFTEEEIARFFTRCNDLDFQVFHPRPAGEADPGGLYGQIADRVDLGELERSLPFSIRPTTDDNPFHFAFEGRHFLRAMEDGVAMPFLSSNPMVSLGLTMGALALLVILAPLIWFFASAKAPPAELRGSLPHLFYFACIGYGYMAIEIAVLFKLQIYLGKPIYGLSVGLFSFLLASGIGSAATQRLGNPPRTVPLLAALMVVVGLAFSLTDPLFEGTRSLPVLARAGVAVATIFPLAFVMGTFLPLGVKLLDRRHSGLIPWAWAINGCLSVVGILGTRTLALFVGFEQAALVGLAAYALLGASVWIFVRPGPARA